MRTVLVLLMGLGGLAACGDDTTAGGGGPQIVATTSILGDVVRNLVGEDASVEVVMPPNADPHDFAPSARQANAMRQADALVINGLGFEEGLVDTIDAAEGDGVPVLAASDAIEPIPFGAEHDHEEPESDEGDEGAHGPDDPHLFTDPVRVRQAAEHLAAALVDEIPALDTDAYDTRVAAYLAELDELDAEVEAQLADIPTERRVLVTNHEVFGYFADRYGFEVLGVVIPGGSTLAETSAADLDELAHEIEEHQVPAIFADASSPTRLADALAAEGAEVEVVELYSESLGEAGSPGDTYIGMIRTNAERIAAALG
jgi:zinc/manganese transport system substrate-binding protein